MAVNGAVTTLGLALDDATGVGVGDNLLIPLAIAQAGLGGALETSGMNDILAAASEMRNNSSTPAASMPRTVGGAAMPPNPNGDDEDNKSGHLFNKQKHNLGNILERHGNDPIRAMRAVQSETQKVISNRGIIGLFEEKVKVEGIEITVRGRVIDGVARIGTAFIPP